jgi:hypothetical protein
LKDKILTKNDTTEHLKIYNTILSDGAHDFETPVVTASYTTEKGFQAGDFVKSASSVNCTDLATYLGFQRD